MEVGAAKLAPETRLQIAVCHVPPGTSRWNKIEHCLFSYVSQTWRGRPLVSHEVIINQIAATITKTGQWKVNSSGPSSKCLPPFQRDHEHVQGKLVA